MREREAAKRREAEALEREAELARQRLEQERLAIEEEEQRQVEREKALEKKKGVGRGVSRTTNPSSSGVRGVRGTRASMRARSVARGRIGSLSDGQGTHVPNFTLRYNHHFGSREDWHPPTFVLDSDSDEYGPVTRPWARLIQPTGIQYTGNPWLKER